MRERTTVPGGAVREGEEVSAGWATVCTCGKVPDNHYCHDCRAFNSNLNLHGDAVGWLTDGQERGKGKAPEAELTDHVPTPEMVAEPEPEEPKKEWRDVGTLGH